MMRLVLLPCVLLLLLPSTQAGNQFVDMIRAAASDGESLLPPLPELFPDPEEGFHNGSHGSAAELYADTAWEKTANNYPRPSQANERGQCNVNEPDLQDASFCDPNSKLTVAQRRLLNDKIKNAVSAQVCHCSPCTSTPRANGRFSINIAIAGYIADNTDTGSPPKCAEIRAPTFGNNLRSSRWANHEKCNEGVWVTYTPANKLIDTQTSSRSRGRLSTSCIKTINEKLKPFLEKDEHFNVLDNLVDYYKHALRGGKCGDKSGLTQDQVIAITCGIIFGVGGLILIIMLCVGFFKNWKCVAGTCLGIIVGAILRAIQIVINILIIKCMSAICSRISDAIPACEEPCACCQCEPLTCVEDVEAGGGGGGGW